MNQCVRLFNPSFKKKKKLIYYKPSPCIKLQLHQKLPNKIILNFASIVQPIIHIMQAKIKDFKIISFNFECK